MELNLYTENKCWLWSPTIYRYIQTVYWDSKLQLPYTMFLKYGPVENKRTFYLFPDESREDE